MRTRIYILLLSFLTGLFISCTDSEVSDMLIAGAYSCKLSLSESTIESDFNAMTRTFTVNADNSTPWQFSEVPSWVTLSPTNGKGTANIKVTFAANEGGERSDVINLINMNSNATGWLPLAVIQTKHPATPVDLGLSVKWSDVNVGASSPEEYGDYYCWGEVNTRSEYTWISYYGSGTSLPKYNNSELWGVVDNKSELELGDDIANVRWGGVWRMPSRCEIEELIVGCTWTWTTQNGVKGYKVSGKKAGFTENSIFLPAAGMHGESGLDSVGVYSFYWSNTLWESFPLMSYGLAINTTDVFSSMALRCYGYPVRGVCRSSGWEGITSLDLTNTVITLKKGQSDTISVSVMSGSNPFPSSGVRWRSGKPGVVEVDENGIVTAKSVGTATITATCYNLSATSTVTVLESDPVIEAVNLGLSVMWATCNVGARSPEDYGNYYAWGETDVKEIYSWDTYKFRISGNDRSNIILSKYNTSSSNGTVDDKTVLEAEDDVAHVKWGGDWRMPSKAEFVELINNCNWVWTTLNGVPGYRVTSKKTGFTDNYIFLPAAGFRGSSVFVNEGSECNYWSNTLPFAKTSDAISDPIYAYGISYSPSDEYASGLSRYWGYQVRPVIPSGAVE